MINKGFSQIFKRFTIQQQLWGGFAILLLILAIVVVNTLFNMSDRQRKVESMTRDIQPTLIASMELKSALKDATTSMGFFLLTREEHRKDTYLNELAAVNRAIQTLKQTPEAQKYDDVITLIQSIEAEINKFITYKGNMIALTETLTDNFTALGYAGTHINPLSNEMLGALSSMMLSEEEEKASAKRKSLLIKIANLRYTWVSVMTNLRVYLNYGNEDALSNVDLFIGGAERLISEIGKYEDMLTFEQEEGLAIVSASIEPWKEHVKVISEMLNSDKVRMDAYLIKTELGPLLHSIDIKIAQLVERQQQTTTQVGDELIADDEVMTRLVTTLLVVGLIIGTLVAWLITRVIVRQVSNSVIELNQSQTQTMQATKVTTDIVSKQRENTEQIAKSVNHMSAVSRDVTQNAEQAASAAHAANQQTEEGSAVVTKALEGINKLAQETDVTTNVIEKLSTDIQQISNVVEIISDISYKTNLLALNAAIEAARAGEQGNGFAVVAEEVRSLAGNTQNSTIEIQAKIETLQKDAKQAVVRIISNKKTAQATADLTVTAGESLNAITQAVDNINTIAIRIANMSEEQSKAAKEVSSNLLNITSLANAADDAAKDITLSCDGLKSVSETLNHMVGPNRA